MVSEAHTRFADKDDHRQMLTSLEYRRDVEDSTWPSGAGRISEPYSRFGKVRDSMNVFKLGWKRPESRFKS